ncbi:hypothetical protein ASPZODRAFT_134707 [Penicilliopsis zonata CBS 506.65]|uniref:Uncharacterized protein n=1 Tax=Penicilliopsis zonata CBS 506.65 TaxID=1073090 RepID=A0A1L9SBN5_9EURO|nr:hypothetical protein ASPZODRAFT_134707 [Penicilliopsis zonata CBS 506.65]OJJ44625.1 hypothetical protein ASPZODRAFT_134707 [Penicilliopsis zonata CBS 506.65]
MDNVPGTAPQPVAGRPFRHPSNCPQQLKPRPRNDRIRRLSTPKDEFSTTAIAVILLFC